MHYFATHSSQIDKHFKSNPPILDNVNSSSMGPELFFLLYTFQNMRRLNCTSQGELWNMLPDTATWCARRHLDEILFNLILLSCCPFELYLLITRLLNNPDKRLTLWRNMHANQASFTLLWLNLSDCLVYLCLSLKAVSLSISGTNIITRPYETCSM